MLFTPGAPVFYLVVADSLFDLYLEIVPLKHQKETYADRGDIMQNSTEKDPSKPRNWTETLLPWHKLLHTHAAQIHFFCFLSPVTVKEEWGK